MDLRDHIAHIKVGLKSGSFVNEASVSQGVVLRLLQALEWPIFDAKIVCPEYSLEGGRADFALCHPAGKPVVLIEVKKTGQAEGTDRQVFEYAFHAGVPMAVLTDGQEWHFYLPGEQGPYQERRVYKLDILEREVDECERRLQRYLGYRAWTAGSALSAAKEDYRDVTRARQIELALPQAWVKVIEEPDDLLLELIADRVESLCGYKPDLDAVASFVSSRVRAGVTESQKTAGSQVPSGVQSVAAAGGRPGPDRLGFRLHSREFSASSARDVLVKVFEELAARDKSFLERFAARARHGRTRRYVAREKSELYPGRPDLADEYSHQLQSGWWIGTNYSRQGITKIIRLASEVAGISFGTDLMVNVG